MLGCAELRRCTCPHRGRGPSACFAGAALLALFPQCVVYMCAIACGPKLDVASRVPSLVPGPCSVFVANDTQRHIFAVATHPSPNASDQAQRMFCCVSTAQAQAGSKLGNGSASVWRRATDKKNGQGPKTGAETADYENGGETAAAAAPSPPVGSLLSLMATAYDPAARRRRQHTPSCHFSTDPTNPLSSHEHRPALPAPRGTPLLCHSSTRTPPPLRHDYFLQGQLQQPQLAATATGPALSATMSPTYPAQRGRCASMRLRFILLQHDTIRKHAAAQARAPQRCCHVASWHTHCARRCCNLVPSLRCCPARPHRAG